MGNYSFVHSNLVLNIILLDILSAFEDIHKSLGKLSILASSRNHSMKTMPVKRKRWENPNRQPMLILSPAILVFLADGTYATETALTSAASARLEAVKSGVKPPLRSQFPF